MCPVILSHLSTNNRRTQLSFASEAEAKVWACRMRRSPKTKSVVLYHSVLPQARHQAGSQIEQPRSEAEPAKKGLWHSFWHWLIKRFKRTPTGIATSTVIELDAMSDQAYEYIITEGLSQMLRKQHAEDER